MKLPGPSFTTLKKEPGKILFIIFMVVAAILMIGSLLLPDLFYDDFIWRYFTGPIYADAEDETVDGIAAGYNPVNTVGYGIILALSVYWIYSLFEKKNIDIDMRFALAIIPYILLGSTLRVLEDANYFGEPLRYLMISPLIYIWLGLFTILMIFMGSYFEEKVNWARVRPKDDTPVEYFLWGTWAAMVIAYGVLYNLDDQFIHVEFILLPMAVILISLAIYFKPLVRFVDEYDSKDEQPLKIYHLYLGVIGWFWCVIAFYHLAWWGWKHATDLRPVVIPGILLMTVASWALMLGFLRFLNSKRNMTFETGFLGLNSLMIFSQFLDGAATYTGLDFYGYREKHVLPSFLIDLTGTAAVMFILKFLVLMFAIYILDIGYREEMKEYPKLDGLMRMVVIILGLAPGMRDMLRLALGT